MCRWMLCLMTMGWFGLFNVAPMLAHCVWPLPPEGAAAPADWQSQIHGPCLNTLQYLRTGLFAKICQNC